MAESSNEDDFRRARADRQRRVSSILKQISIDDDLDVPSRRKLAALVLRHDVSFRLFQELAEGARAARADTTKGPAQRRVFFRKVAAAAEALDAALVYATDAAKTDVLRQSLRDIALPRLRRAQEALAEVLDWPDWLAPTGVLNLQDPRSKATADLADFFDGECGLSKFEAQTRTAEIFRAFGWRQSNTSGDEDREVEREAEAIRKRRSRARRATK